MQTSERVERAVAGDDEAFAGLVRAFQDMAVGTAFGWLRDIELAREVAQEAFADAHRLLGQLEDPAAFPGWLRRIVLKHCDRVTRRGRLAPADWARAQDGAAPESPEDALAEREACEHLRLCVEALPERERVLVALHYFAGEAQPAIAEFLELPLSTVKKRLRDARARLSERRKELMTRSLNALRPSRSEDFGDTVRFYIALRAGDTAAMRRMLERRPELCEVEQSWGPERVAEGVLPFANRATPLITAVERGDTAVVDLLLELGAAPDGACGCATGESALWAAVLLERPSLAERLLVAGADPDRRSVAGNTALHLAAMRGSEPLAKLLLEHGADPDLRDAGGRRALEWAEAKGHASVASLLGGAGSRPVRPAAPEASGRVLETGIKALDLLAPLRRGGLVRVPARAGAGMIVLLTELCQRFTREGACALWTGFAQGPFDPTDLAAGLGEGGLGGRVAIHLAPATASPAARREAFADGLGAAESAAREGREVFVVLLCEEGYETDVEASLPGLAQAPGARVTTVVVTPFARAEAWEELAPPYDGQLVLERRRVAARLLPAVDPVRSLSRALDEDVSPRHREVAAAVRELLAGYEALDPELALPLPDTRPEPERARFAAAQRLLRFLTQPFLTTEPFHARPARVVPLATTLEVVERIVRGDAVAPGEMELLGEIGPHQLRDPSG